MKTSNIARFILKNAQSTNDIIVLVINEQNGLMKPKPISRTNN